MIHFLRLSQRLQTPEWDLLSGQLPDVGYFEILVFPFYLPPVFAQACSAADLECAAHWPSCLSPSSVPSTRVDNASRLGSCFDRMQAEDIPSRFQLEAR